MRAIVAFEAADDRGDGPRGRKTGCAPAAGPYPRLMVGVRRTTPRSPPVNRASLIRLLVLLPILAACVVGYLYTQTTHATGRPVGPIPAAANAAATVRVDATGIPILVPVPEGFVALDP